MSTAHKGSKLILPNAIIPTDEHTVGVWHFDNHLYSSRGVKPVGEPVVTLRHDGYFDGCVAVEDGTTNLVPINRTTFEGWTQVSGASISITQNMKLDKITDHGATRIQSSGGSEVLKYSMRDVSVGQGGIDTECSWSIWVYNLSNTPMYVTTETGANSPYTAKIVEPQEIKKITWSIQSQQSNYYRRLGFQTDNIEDELDVIVYQPQIESKSFPSSFVEGSRGNGFLPYPKELLNPSAFTINTWIIQRANSSEGFSSYNPIFEICSSSHQNYRLLFMYSGTDTLRAWYGNDSMNSSTSAFSSGIPINEWHMCTLSYDGSTYRIYVNGELRTSSNNQAVSFHDNATFNVGGRYWGRLNGFIDEFRIDNIARTDDEILSWYLTQAPFYDTLDTTSMAY